MPQVKPINSYKLVSMCRILDIETAAVNAAGISAPVSTSVEYAETMPASGHMPKYILMYRQHRPDGSAEYIYFFRTRIDLVHRLIDDLTLDCTTHAQCTFWVYSRLWYALLCNRKFIKHHIRKAEDYDE